MNKIFVKIGLAMLVAASVMTTSDAENIKMMTYNIKGHGMTSHRLDNVADVINTNAPDIVAVQEVDNRTIIGMKYDYFADLGEATGMKHNFFPLVGSYYGIGILSKTEPLSVQTKSFPFSDSSKDKEDRGFIIAEFEDFFFMCTHYSLNANDRDTATDWAVDFALESGKTVFIAGDFNAKPTYRAMVTFKNSGFDILNNTDLYTYPAESPTSCIDMIISYSENAGNRKYEVVESGLGKAGATPLANVSDHMPVYIVVQPKGAGTGDLERSDIEVKNIGASIIIDGLIAPSEVTVSDLSGRTIARVDGYENGGTIDIGAAGIYIISAKNGNEKTTVKYIINN